MSNAAISTIALALAVTAAAAGSAAAQTFHHYECSDGSAFEIVFYPRTKAAYVQLDGKALMLPKRFSFISQRFKKNGVSVAMRGGGKAILKRGGKTSQCAVR
jgi:hypothetical protein